MAEVLTGAGVTAGGATAGAEVEGTEDIIIGLEPTTMPEEQPLQPEE